MAGHLKLTGKIAEKALILLEKVCWILDQNNIPYTLEGGTLLGIIREDRLLPWDNDMDITITEEYLDQLIKIRYKFWLIGYRTRIRTSKSDIPYFPKKSIRLMKIQTTRCFFKEYNLLDIFIKIKDKEKYFWIVDEKDPVLKSVPAYFYENRTRVHFNGYDYLVPEKFEDYLTYRYGDWKQVQKDYHYKKDDHAIINS